MRLRRWVKTLLRVRSCLLTLTALKFTITVRLDSRFRWTLVLVGRRLAGRVSVIGIQMNVDFVLLILLRSRLFIIAGRILFIWLIRRRGLLLNRTVLVLNRYIGTVGLRDGTIVSSDGLDIDVTVFIEVTDGSVSAIYCWVSYPYTYLGPYRRESYYPYPIYYGTTYVYGWWYSDSSR